MEDELESFRAEWKNDLRNPINRSILPISIPATSISPPSSKPIRLFELSEELDEMEEEIKLNNELPTALELYSLAVLSEKEGRLNDALFNYRAAFKLDEAVDKLYHKQSLLNSTKAIIKKDDFEFERTIQLYSDYIPHQGEEYKNTLSTNLFRDNLINSFTENPWIREPIATEIDQVEQQPMNIQTIEETYPTLSFIPADPTLPLYLSSLPHEVLLIILRFLTMSANLPPPPVRPADLPAPVTTINRKGKGKMNRTISEELNVIELDLGLEKVIKWKSDVESLERFSKVCRYARILTLEEGLWRDLSIMTYQPPHQIPPEQSFLHLLKTLHNGDFRRFFIEFPRLRFDGFYVAVITYLRRGESSQAWSTPTHLITFYRYLRFYPNGLVISLLSTDAPVSVVKTLNPLLRVKGLTLGKWKLRSDSVECWSLQDPNVSLNARKYSFRMELKLRSTARGKMNKLELLTLATENRLTEELEDIPTRPNKPFYFSKVRGYSHEY